MRNLSFSRFVAPSRSWSRMRRVASLALSALGSIVLLNVATSSSLPKTPTPGKETPSALHEVSETIEAIVHTVEKYPGEALTKERREKLREVINPRFDFREMAKRSLGTAWTTAEESEREEFVKVFSDLLARTYLNHIETVKRGMVKVLSEDVSGEEGHKAVVKTEVTNKGSTFPIVYKLALTDQGWRAYDVVIENIGLVANYRNEFAAIIRKEKLQGLITKLKEKNKSQES